MTMTKIDWGDRPDWRARLEAARQPPSREQSAWDAHFDRMLGIAARTAPDPNVAVKAAMARTTDEHGERPEQETR